MEIVERMIEHIKIILGNFDFTHLDINRSNAIKYNSLEDYFKKDNYFWHNLISIESNNFSAANILTTFLKDDSNYQLFIKDYSLLKLSAIKNDYQFIPAYLKDKQQLVFFLQNADLSVNSNYYYFKEAALGKLIKSLCVSDLEDNKLIIKNFLDTHKKFFTNTKVKIYLRTALYESFYEEIEFFASYYKPKSEQESLIVDMKDTKVLCYFLDKKYLMEHFSLNNATDMKDYLKMLKQIAEVIKKEFKLSDLKLTEYNPNTYNIIALVKEDFNYDLTVLWEPMIEQFLMLPSHDADKKAPLTKYLKTMILYQDINSKVPNKEEVKSVSKKLKI